MKVSNSRLTLIEKLSKGKGAKGLYRCDCGIVKELLINNVNTGNTKSCGCLNYETIKAQKHGFATPEKVHHLYLIWGSIKSRCYNAKVKNYIYYGAKGVEMCELWKNDFMAFHDWCMANGWKKGLQIDKDIIAMENGWEPNLYSPERCCIVEAKINQNSRSNNIKISYKGEILSIGEICDRYSIPYGKLYLLYCKEKIDIETCIKKLKK